MFCSCKLQILYRLLSVSIPVKLELLRDKNLRRRIHLYMWTILAEPIPSNGRFIHFVLTKHIK